MFKIGAILTLLMGLTGCSCQQFGFELKAEDGGTSIQVTSGVISSGPDASYSSPDDYNILKAQTALLATPHSSDYNEIARQAFLNVHQTCANDFSRICETPDIQTMNTADFIGQLFGAFDAISALDSQYSDFQSPMFTNFFRRARRLLKSDKKSRIPGSVPDFTSTFSIVELVDLFSPKSLRGSKSHRKLQFLDPSFKMSGDDDDDYESWKRHKHSGSEDPKEPDHDEPRLPGPAGKGKQGPCIHGGRHGVPPPPSSPPPPRQNNDFIYTGELGYGNDGDNCIYTNFDQLSIDCKDAILTVHELRDQYWQEEEDEHHPPLFVLFICMAFFFYAVRVIARLFGPHARRAQHTRAVLVALEKNPELKAAVEAAANVQVPAPRPECTFKRGSCFFGRILLAVAASLFIVHIAGAITYHIAMGMVYTDEDGYEHLPSVFAVMIIMITLIVIQTVAVVSAMRAIRKCFNPNDSGSAAHVNPEASNQGVPTSGIVFALPSFLNFRAREQVPVGYVPLNQESMHGPVPSSTNGSEMVPRHYQRAIPTVVHYVDPTANCIAPVTIL